MRLPLPARSSTLPAPTSPRGQLSGLVGAVAAVPRLPLLVPLHGRDFALLWGGNAVSLAGDQFQMVALAVLALDLTGSTAVLGTVLGVQAVPRALLMLAGGVAADRFAPRRMMLAAHALQGLLVALLAGALAAGQLAPWHLYVYAALSGTVLGFAIPAANALVPLLVSRERLRSANALGSLNFNLASAVYPPLAGALVAAMGHLPAFALNAGSFFVAAVAVSGIRAPGAAAPRGASVSPLRQCLEGIAAARGDRVVWLAIVVGAIFSLGYTGAVLVGLPALAKLSLDAGSAGVGVLFGAAGAGAIIGAVAVGSLPRVPRAGLACGVMLFGAGATLVLVASAPSVAVAVPVLVVSGFLRAAAANIATTMVQARSPAEARGRVMALFMLGVNGLAPLSLGLGGLLGAALGPRALLVAGGVVVALAGAYAVSQQAFRDAD